MTTSNFFIYVPLFPELLLVHADALADDFDRLVAVGDLLDGRLLVLERFIDFKEVHHLIEDVLGQFLDVVIVVVGGISVRDRDDLFVERTAVDHLDDPDGIAVDEGHGIDDLAREHEHVQGVAVLGKRARDKPVVGGIDGGSEENAVELQKPRLLVQFILCLTALGDLNERFKGFFGDAFFGNVVPDVHEMPPYFLYFITDRLSEQPIPQISRKIFYFVGKYTLTIPKDYGMMICVQGNPLANHLREQNHAFALRDPIWRLLAPYCPMKRTRGQVS